MTTQREYLTYAHDTRGRIINSIAEMEQRIDWYIADHFCSDLKKRTELMEVIISTKHLTFNSKAEIIEFLLKRKGHASGKEAEQIRSHFRKIGDKRNVLAHCSLDTSLTAIRKFEKDKETVSFIKYLHTKQPVYFGKKDIVELLELTNNISGLLLLTKSPIYHLMK